MKREREGVESFYSLSILTIERERESELFNGRTSHRWLWELQSTKYFVLNLLKIPRKKGKQERHTLVQYPQKNVCRFFFHHSF